MDSQDIFKRDFISFKLHCREDVKFGVGNEDVDMVKFGPRWCLEQDRLSYVLYSIIMLTRSRMMNWGILGIVQCISAMLIRTAKLIRS